MKYNLNECSECPLLHSKNNIVIEINKEFIDLTGYSKSEVIGKSLNEISIMLRIDSQTDFEKIASEYHCYMFTNKYEPKEIIITTKILDNQDEKIYYLKVKSNLKDEGTNTYLEQIFKDNKMGVAIISFPDSIILSCNQKYLYYMEHPYNIRENIVGKNIKRVISRYCQNHEEIFIFNELEMGRSHYENEVKYDQINKVVKYFDISLVPIIREGKTKYIACTVTDVTEKVEHQKLINDKIIIINEQKEELEAIIDNMYEYLIIFDKNGNITKLNRSAKNHIFHSSKIEKIEGYLKYMEVYDCNGNLISNTTMINKILKGEKISRIKYTLKINNIVKYIEVNGRPIYDKNGTFTSGILLVHDITEKVKAEENFLIKTQYEVLNRLIKNLELGFVRVSYPDFNIKYLNKKAYRELIKINPSTKSSPVIGKNIFDMFTFDNNRDTEFENNLKNLISRNSVSECCSRKYIIEGKEKFAKILCQPLLGLNNMVTEVIFISIDMTEEVKDKNKMEEALKIQDEIFANISHELKTPLNVIFSTNQLMELYFKKDILAENKEKISKNIKTVKQKCYRFTKLINNIIDISKIDSGFLSINLSNENIVSVVEDIIQSVSEYVKKKNLSITFDTNVEEKIIACDPDKIERIILNLISNAIKFTNPNGSIFVSIIDKGETVELIVKDTGIGINSNCLTNIFKRFHQADKSFSRNAEGSGIGLYLVKSIVELHGGSISVDSKIGEGSTFKILFPGRTVENPRIIEEKKSNSSKIEMINIEFSDIYSIE